MLLNKDEKIWKKLTKEEQEEIKACDNIKFMLSDGTFVNAVIPSWDKTEVYQAEKIEKEFVPWELKEFVGKMLRVRSIGVFCVVTIDVGNNEVKNGNYDFHSPKWWLRNGECYTSEGKIVPCGKEVLKC